MASESPKPVDATIANGILALVGVAAGVAALLFGLLAAWSIAIWDWSDAWQVFSPAICLVAFRLWAYLQDYLGAQKSDADRMSELLPLVPSIGLFLVCMSFIILFGLVSIGFAMGIPRQHNVLHIGLRGAACLVVGITLIWPTLKENWPRS